MWNNLPEKDRNEYKKMILAFASLTEMFAQKADNEDTDIIYSPIINSKYQETVFQKVFNASAEDIGNTSYDAGIRHVNENGEETKYLIGIKTFGLNSGAQKVAQFKANHDEWAELINKMKDNAMSIEESGRSKEAINGLNKELYLELARRIAELRNKRIASSEAKLQGFSISKENDDVQPVYHVLMPSPKGATPAIHVGEIEYDRISLDDIEVVGCTGVRNPTNFVFTDGNHTYKYTSADSQLYMDFKNYDIVQESWEVKYAEDAYALFANLANQIYGDEIPEITESYSWMITNKNDEVELFSGFNSFYGVGSKLALDGRDKAINRIQKNFEEQIDEDILNPIIELLTSYLKDRAGSAEEKRAKVSLRNQIIELVEGQDNADFKDAMIKLLYRPYNEMYIPIPNSKAFHEAHPDFFGKNVGTFKVDGNKLALDASEREFTLVFEPSGDSLKAYIAQDSGKAIESTEKQTYLGEWVLRGVFQLEKYEPLTVQKLNEVGINGIRLYKLKDSDEIHLQFIWIDKDNLPKDYIK